MFTKKRFFLIFLVLCLAFSFTACGGSDKEAEDGELTNVDVDTSLDGDSGKITSDQGSLEYGEDIDFPKEVPLDEPKGTLVGVMNDAKTGQYTIALNEMEMDDAKDYIQYLKDEGFASTMEMSDADMVMYSGTKSNNESAVFIYNAEPKEASLTYIPDMAAVQ